MHPDTAVERRDGEDLAVSVDEVLDLRHAASVTSALSVPGVERIVEYPHRDDGAGELAASARMADAAPSARSDEPARRSAGRRRLCGVQAQVASSAELAVRVGARRRDRARSVARWRGRLIKTWAMRGTLHLLTPEDGRRVPLADGRGTVVGAAELAALLRRDAEAMDELRATRPRGARRRGAHPGGAGHGGHRTARVWHVGEELRSGWGTLLKPLAWQGDLCFGPSQGNARDVHASGGREPRWAGIPDPEDAARVAIAAYFGAYGPATIDAFGNWLAGGWFGKRSFAPGSGRSATGWPRSTWRASARYVLAEDVDELAVAEPTDGGPAAARVRPVRPRARAPRRPRHRRPRAAPR